MDALPAGLRAGRDAVVRALPGTLEALYLSGSAVAGGLRPDSDVDLLAVLRAPLSASARCRLGAALLAASGRWDAGRVAAGGARPIELTAVVRSRVVPWRHPAEREFQYGEWRRAALEAGEVDAPCDDPDLTILLAALHGAGVPLVGPPAAALLDPVPHAHVVRAIADSLPAIAPGLEEDARNALLTLARMWVTLRDGEIVAKDVAAARLLPHLPAAHRPTLDLARRAYRGEARDDWTTRRADVRALAAWSAAEIERLVAAAGRR